MSTGVDVDTGQHDLHVASVHGPEERGHHPGEQHRFTCLRGRGLADNLQMKKELTPRLGDRVDDPHGASLMARLPPPHVIAAGLCVKREDNERDQVYSSGNRKGATTKKIQVQSHSVNGRFGTCRGRTT